jgi:hypothetical protein
MAVGCAEEGDLAYQDRAAPVEQIGQARVSQVNLAFDAAIVREADEFDLCCHGVPVRSRRTP